MNYSLEAVCALANSAFVVEFLVRYRGTLKCIVVKVVEVYFNSRVEISSYNSKWLK